MCEVVKPWLLASLLAVNMQWFTEIYFQGIRKITHCVIILIFINNTVYGMCNCTYMYSVHVQLYMYIPNCILMCQLYMYMYCTVHYR